MHLIYFSPVPWASYRQRPHYMVEHLLEHGVERAIWVDPYPTRLPLLSDTSYLLRIGRRMLGGRATTPRGSHPRVDVISPRALPIEPLPLGPALNFAVFFPPAIAALRAVADNVACMIVVGRPSRLAHWALHHLPHVGTLYDAMDDFPSFYSGLSSRSMASIERDVACSVSHIVCSAPSLVEKFAAMGLGATWIPNGYTMSTLPEPSPRAARKVVGYVGTIGRWFDWPLVLEIARALPDLQFRLIGPEFVPRPPRLPPNIEMRPECSQAEAVEQIGSFQVGLIPFRPLMLTNGVDPIKYYEYRALGVPVWTTSFGTMSKRIGGFGVTAIGHGSDWPSIAQALLTFEDAPDFVAQFRRENDWSARFASLPLAAHISETV